MSETEYVKLALNLFNSDFNKHQIYEPLNVYLVGSQIYGTARPDSDYDLILVCDGPYFYGLVFVENVQFQISIYHHQFFASELEKHLFLPVLCMFLPLEYRWMEKIKFHFCLKLPNLRKATLQEASHNYQKAKRLFTKEKNPLKAKKNIVHGLRYLNYAKQLFESGSILQFIVENETYVQIMQNNFSEWNQLEQMFFFSIFKLILLLLFFF